MTNVVFTFEDGSQALSHHGVKGMKWGIRRYQNKDGSLTGVGKSRYGTEKSSNNKGLSDKTKKRLKTAAIIGASAVGIGLAAYGGYKLHSKMGKTYVNSGKDYINGFRDRFVGLFGKRFEMDDFKRDSGDMFERRKWKRLVKNDPIYGKQGAFKKNYDNYARFLNQNKSRVRLSQKYNPYSNRLHTGYQPKSYKVKPKLKYVLQIPK